MRIAVLGPLAMWAADRSPLDVRGVRLRGLLARLALSAGRPVGVETLVDGLWGEGAPSANALQSLVSRLRAGLPATESSISVQSGPAGYTLSIGPDCVDALQFEDLVRRGRGLLGSDPNQARVLLTQAERLWRGEALADLRDLPFAAIEADRLAELRLGATEQLAASGELDRIRSTHLTYFADLVRQGGKQLRTGAQLQWIARFDADNENLLGALRNAIDAGDAETSLAVVAVLGEYWNMRGRPAEALGWFEAALALTGPADPLTKATTLMLYAFGTLSFGDDPSQTFREALRGLARVRLLSRRHAAVAESGIGLFTNGVWAGIRRDSAECFRYLDAAREHPDAWTRAMAVQLQAALRENEGDVDRMAADLTSALDQFRALGDRWGMSLALHGLGAYQGLTGDHRGAHSSRTPKPSGWLRNSAPPTESRS